MRQVSVVLPDNIPGLIRSTPAEICRELLVAATVEWHREGRLSANSGAEALGISPADFQQEITNRQIKTAEPEMATSELPPDPDTVAKAMLPYLQSVLGFAPSVPPVQAPAPLPEIAGVIRELGDLGDGAVLFEAGVASLLRRHPCTIRRAVQRKELPPPVRLIGQPAWTVGAIRRHLNQRLEKALQDAERETRRLERLKP